MLDKLASMTSDHEFTLKGFKPVATDLLIGKEWRAGQGPRIDVVDPADGKSLTTISNASVADAMAALDAAAAAAKDWAATPPRQRGEILRRAFEAMTRETEWLAALMTAENGKPLAESRGEIAYAADFFRWYAEEAVRMLGEVSLAPAGNARLMVEYQPVGPCLLITPWNFPAAMVTRKIGPALAAGCTVILKPAIETPLTALTAQAPDPAEIASLLAAVDVGLPVRTGPLGLTFTIDTPNGPVTVA